MAVMKNGTNHCNNANGHGEGQNGQKVDADTVNGNADVENAPEKAEKRKVYEAERVIMSAWICQTMMFRSGRISSVQLFKLLLLFWGMPKCIKHFETPAELVTFILARCQPMVMAVEDDQDISLCWNDPDGQVSKRIRAQLVQIGRNVCATEYDDEQQPMQ